eukprot:CAMPEP_0183305356 /NCGR_PEP_ID=MMETSP0160_2-20130417/10122_1 /TAXON_ID=2839 ORGANISM="Odontella Sinensis, Strain Grunow 1884" /NCGR_SAMPLE_ID=MMETSP0160_2 /ASSEMBLY_ACC=CAM_ASM_000250 /LENGTH=321 /DNA_ID=CAMNT_0025468541 /DNA_START=69 /DNA_END=1034 /DNA_ORIENTATION=-
MTIPGGNDAANTNGLDSASHLPGLVPADEWEESNEGKEGGDEPAAEGAKEVVATKVGARPTDDGNGTGVNAIDTFLSGWTTWAGDAYLNDRGLKILQWSLWLGSRLTDPAIFPPARVYHRRLNPNLSPGLRKMYLDMSMVRYALRLYGFPSSLEAIRTGSWWAGWTDPRIHKLGKVMAWSMAMYYPLEHVAYARWVAPVLVKADAERYTALSCRAWTTYIVADLLGCFLKIRELRSRSEAVGREGGKMSEGEVQEKRCQLEKQIGQQRLQILRCGLFMLPAVHWSLPKWERDPWLSENVVNGLMFAESVVCFYQSLKGMQK